jgi:hypothetical protein
MNVKFKMPKFGRHLSSKGWLKELALTFLATTISIVLTFGTAQHFEYKQKVANGRLMAMMVIHDMDNTIETLTKLGNEHVKIAKMAQYLMDNQERLESVYIDSLEKVLDYLIASDNSPQQYRLDESTEMVFLSSQDSWKNIDNATFIDEVQKFYIERHALYDHINSSSRWRQPIGEDDYKAELKKDLLINDVTLLRKFLGEDDVNFYINMATNRKQELNLAAYRFKQISDRCKFTMGITDEELATYIETRERTGNNVKEHELIGPWIMIKTTEYDYILEYAADHTYIQTSVSHQPAPIFNGCIDTKYITTGTWELRDDTLLMVLKPGIKFEMDDSHVTPKPGMEQKTKDYAAEIEASGKAYAKGQDIQEDRPRSYAASIDPTGKKIELMWTELDADGNEVKQAYYLTKQEDKNHE